MQDPKVKAERREYLRRWREKNPDIIRKINVKYYEKDIEKSRAASREYARLRRINNPEKLRAADRKSMLKHDYGITVEEYDAMSARQNGVCAICGRPQSARRGRLSIDHDHKTGSIRGLLCTNCNSALGMVNDRIDLLKEMIEYILRWSDPEVSIAD